MIAVSPDIQSGSPLKLENDERRALRVAQYLLVSRNVRLNLLALPAFAFVLCWVFSNWVSVNAVASWWTCVLAASLLSSVIDIRQTRAGLQPTEIDVWLNLRCIQALVYNVVWILPAFLFWPYFNDIGKLLLILIYACSMSGAVALAAPCPKWAASLMAPLMFAIVIPPLMEQGWLYQSIGALAFGYSAFMAYLTYLHFSSTRDMLELRDKNADLVKQLSAAIRLSDQARAQAEAASRSKSDFLANMSHELRTPLNAVIGFSDMIKSRVWGDQAIDRYAGYAENINASGQHLLSLINDILDLAKIEAGKFELNESKVELSYVAREALRLVEPQAQAKGVRAMIDASTQVWVRADERAMRQILANLLANAVKFTRADGAIIIFTTLQECGGVSLAVKDSGIGIKPEDLARVMETFGQGRHDIVATQERGTGLGLPIVKGLVEAHGGRIEIESEVGVGTMVTVKLPAERVLPSFEIDSNRATA